MNVLLSLSLHVSSIYKNAAATRPAAAAATSKPAATRPAAAVTWSAAELVVFVG